MHWLNNHASRGKCKGSYFAMAAKALRLPSTHEQNTKKHGETKTEKFKKCLVVLVALALFSLHGTLDPRQLRRSAIASGVCTMAHVYP